MRVGIIGASGYTGAELLRILDGHPEVEVDYITAHTYAGKKVADLYPHLHRYREMEFHAFDLEEALSGADFHFVALPHGESMRVVPQLLEGGAKVADLSADYRLPDREAYTQWYGLEHTSAHLLCRGGIRAPRDKRRAHRRSQPGGRAGMLSHRGDPGPGAVGRSGPARGCRGGNRCKIRCIRGGKIPFAGRPFRAGGRERQAL